jgi:hypothetical protein
MSRLKVLAAALAVALGWSGTAEAGPMLTGTVTYDRSTQLYTYSYVLDDRAAPAPVDVVFIRVATHNYDVIHLSPVSHTAPAPFSDFQLATAADVNGNEAVFASGTVYGWEAGSAAAAPGSVVPPGAGVYGGFSFTSRYGPGTGDGSNYELFATSLYNAAHQYDARVEVGRVVAPELANAPEPGTLALAIAGSAVVGLRGLRRRGRVCQPTGR